MREHLRKQAHPLCSQVGAIVLPPFHAINHLIPLINKSKIYPWWPSRCPEAMCELWIEKKNVYLKTGHWKMTTAQNTCPMLLISKAGTPPRLWVVVDLWEWNKNTWKLSSPMLDMEGIETTLRANTQRTTTPRTLRRNRITSVLERKPKESSNGEPLGAGLQQYIYYTTRVLCEAIHEAVCCMRQWTQLPSCGKTMLMTSRDTACTARGCGPDQSTDRTH